jgi:hypothetical protein
VTKDAYIDGIITLLEQAGASAERIEQLRPRLSMAFDKGRPFEATARAALKEATQ